MSNAVLSTTRTTLESVLYSVGRRTSVEYQPSCTYRYFWPGARPNIFRFWPGGLIHCFAELAVIIIRHPPVFLEASLLLFCKRGDGSILHCCSGLERGRILLVFWPGAGPILQCLFWPGDGRILLLFLAWSWAVYYSCSGLERKTCCDLMEIAGRDNYVESRGQESRTDRMTSTGRPAILYLVQQQWPF